jgi:hypothetical protein
MIDVAPSEMLAASRVVQLVAEIAEAPVKGEVGKQRSTRQIVHASMNRKDL